MDVSENRGSTSLSTPIWGFPKMVVPNIPQQPLVFPTKNDHGVFWGYHHLRKHPYYIVYNDNGHEIPR